MREIRSCNRLSLFFSGLPHLHKSCMLHSCITFIKFRPAIACRRSSTLKQRYILNTFNWSLWCLKLASRAYRIGGSWVLERIDRHQHEHEGSVIEWQGQRLILTAPTSGKGHYCGCFRLGATCELCLSVQLAGTPVGKRLFRVCHASFRVQTAYGFKHLSDPSHSAVLITD